MQGLTTQCVIFSSNSLSKCPYWMVDFFLCSKSETQSLVAPPVFQFAKYMDLFIKLSCIARASRLALSPSRLLSQWMNNCDFSLSFYDATWRGTAQQASIKQTVHENKLWKPAAQRIAESGRQVTPPPTLPPQKNKQQKFAKCPHARGRSTLQVMDFEGAEMFIWRDEQNYGGGMRGSCRMCHVARKKCWWEPWIYVLKVGVELRWIIWGDRLGDQAIKNPNVSRRSWLPHPDAVEKGAGDILWRAAASPNYWFPHF